jgi:hypothetical protein
VHLVAEDVLSILGTVPLLRYRLIRKLQRIRQNERTWFAQIIDYVPFPDAGRCQAARWISREHPVKFLGSGSARAARRNL